MKTPEAWEKRIQAGQAGGGMNNRFGQVGRLRAIGMYANWTDRVTAGELPTEAPARPQGERAQRCHHHVGLGRREDLCAR
jgi:hypothetical protein